MSLIFFIEQWSKSHECSQFVFCCVFSYGPIILCLCGKYDLAMHALKHHRPWYWLLRKGDVSSSKTTTATTTYTTIIITNTIIISLSFAVIAIIIIDYCHYQYHNSLCFQMCIPWWHSLSRSPAVTRVYIVSYRSMETKSSGASENRIWPCLGKIPWTPGPILSGRSNFNTLRTRRNGQHFADDIFKRIFFNENVRISIKISLTFVPKGPIYNIPALVQMMAWRRPGDKPLFEPMMDTLPTHICVTRPQWVNPSMDK